MMETQEMMENILSYFDRPKCGPAELSQLQAFVKAQGGEAGGVKEAVLEMVGQGKLVLTQNGRYATPAMIGLLAGRIQGNAKGFGFLIPDDEEAEDLFIPANGMKSAMHKDRVLCRIIRQPQNGRSGEGEVVQILSRANSRVVGLFDRPWKSAFVIPDDPRLGQDIHISHELYGGAKHEDKVVVEIIKWPSGNRAAEGKVVEVLGNKDEPGCDVLSIIRQAGLPEVFPQGVLDAARAIPQEVPEAAKQGRKDFRDWTVMTIDGADSKDLDDAISIKRLENGRYQLGVHIADVSHYVQEGSLLDQEALLRGTSVYFADRVIPMLPPELSNGICSLNPDVDRLTLSCIMEIDEAGEVQDAQIVESVINNKYRMTYDGVNKIFAGDEEMCRAYAPILEDLGTMRELMDLLLARRERNGGLDFDVPEAKIILNEKGRAVDVVLRERGISERMIEEFMLAANRSVALCARHAELPFLYRVHEDPDKDKMKEFAQFVNAFGYTLKVKGKVTPKQLQELLEQIQGTPEENVINQVMLRSMQKAKYLELPLGHFGLAAPDYCHFTSPIRRYPDLEIHRILKEWLHGKLDEKRVKQLEKAMPGIAQQTSQAERSAMEAERAVDDLKKAEYMMDHVGEEYEGVISGVTQYGVYVQLPNTVEGLVHVSALDNDYYVFDEKRYALIGERTRKSLRLGDPARVRVDAVDVDLRRIDFGPAPGWLDAKES